MSTNDTLRGLLREAERTLYQLQQANILPRRNNEPIRVMRAKIDAALAEPVDDLRERYLDLLVDVLDAKDAMLAACIPQGPFAEMFPAFVTKLAEPVAGQDILMPINPSIEMIEALAGVVSDMFGIDDCEEGFREAYKAMVNVVKGK